MNSDQLEAQFDAFRANSNVSVVRFDEINGSARGRARARSRWTRAVVVSGLIVALCFGTAALGRGSGDSDPLPISASGMKESDAPAPGWDVRTSVYRSTILANLKATESFVGSAIDSRTGTITIYGYGEPPPEFYDAVNSAPSDTRLVWSATRYTSTELHAAQATLLTDIREAGMVTIADDYAELIVTVDPIHSDNIMTLQDEADSLVAIPVSVVTGESLHVLGIGPR